MQGQISQAEADRNNYINNKAQVDAQIPSLRAERDQLQAQVNGQH